MKPVSRQPGRRHQEGFLLLGVLFMILLILFALAVAAPKMAEQIRRDKEVETVHRGLQYARAIRVFYSKYGRYPSSIDQLMKTDNQRFLRKRYLDPMTGKDDWRIIHLGEAKVPPMGLFGQTMQSNTITPTGASTGSTTGFGGTSSPFGSSGSSSFGGGSSSLGSSGSSSFGGGSSSFGSSTGSSGSAFGSSSSSPFGGNSGSAFGNTGSSSSPTGSTDSGSGSSPTIGGTVTTGQTASGAFGSPGVSVGGAPIVGVGLLSKKESIKVYKKQTHYNQWEFVFDPTQNALQATAGAATNTLGGSNGTGVGGASAPGFGNGTGNGSSNGSGFSNGSGGSGFGGTPSSPVSPTSPVSNSPQ